MSQEGDDEAFHNLDQWPGTDGFHVMTPNVKTRSQQSHISSSKLGRLNILQSSIAARNKVGTTLTLERRSLVPLKQSQSTRALHADASAHSLRDSQSEYQFNLSTPFNSVEERGYYTPSDRIARNYTLSAQSLTFRDLDAFFKEKI